MESYEWVYAEKFALYVEKPGSGHGGRNQQQEEMQSRYSLTLTYLSPITIISTSIA